MPKLRINVRAVSEIDDPDLLDELEAEVEAFDDRDDRTRGRDERRVINPVALQRRQDSRKWGKEIARSHRERKNMKP